MSEYNDGYDDEEDYIEDTCELRMLELTLTDKRVIFIDPLAVDYVVETADANCTVGLQSGVSFNIEKSAHQVALMVSEHLD